MATKPDSPETESTAVSVINMSRHAAVTACTQFGQTGLVVKKNATIEQIEALSKNVSGFKEKVGNAYRWWAGDIGNAAEKRGEEAMTRAADALGMTLRDFQNCITVSKRIEINDRVDGLTWSAHRAVVSIPDSRARNALLAQAKADGLSSRQIEALVKAWKIANGMDGDNSRDNKAGDTIPDAATPDAQVSSITLYEVISFIKRATTSDLQRIEAAFGARNAALVESLSDHDSNSAVDDALAAFEAAIKNAKSKK